MFHKLSQSRIPDKTSTKGIRNSSDNYRHKSFITYKRKRKRKKEREKEQEKKKKLKKKKKKIRERRKK